MKADALTQALRAQPWRPITLQVAGGSEVVISRPETAAHNATARTLVVVADDGSFSVVDTDLVTRIDVGPPTDEPR